MPTFSFFSHCDYTAGGTTSQFGVTIAYLEQSDITVTVNGVSTPFAWVTDSLIQTLDVNGNPFAPPSGAVVRIQRATPIDQPKAVYQDGSTLSGGDLMEDDLQNLYAIQELSEQVAALQAAINNLTVVAGNLPAVTTGNNGYVLQVVNGAWTLVPTSQVTVVYDEQVDGTNRLIQKKSVTLNVIGSAPAPTSWITVHTGTGC